ncbi:hypothetical protein [Streptomyces sp. NPDC051636]|uniref:hypothetical protein n=1 Tax=Streptomyces sp. NPDC051636 TaxID=3365663 RepID=UPI003787BEFC
MDDVLNTAANWLEHGKPGERRDLGAPIWSAGGVQAVERQDPDAYRLSLVTAASVLTYEVVGIEGGWLR